MKLKLEMLLNRRRLDVWRAFDDPENLQRWQPALQTVRHIQGTPGNEGAVSVLTYSENGRQVAMEQVILEKVAPELVVTTTHGEQHSNRVVNTFESVGATQTRWHVEVSYRFRGFSRLISPLLRSTIRKHTLADMERFKKFVEQI